MGERLAGPVSTALPPNPCHSCGTALIHCTEMRNPCELDDVAATACCNECLLHYPGLHETEQERRARHLTPGAHRSVSGYRTTADLRPGDTVRMSGPTVRTVKTNVPSRPGSHWDGHVLIFEDGTSFWSESTDRWEVLPQAAAPPPEIQYGLRTPEGVVQMSEAQARHLQGPSRVLVSRVLPPWEVLR